MWSPGLHYGLVQSQVSQFYWQLEEFMGTQDRYFHTSGFCKVDIRLPGDTLLYYRQYLARQTGQSFTVWGEGVQIFHVLSEDSFWGMGKHKQLYNLGKALKMR